MVSCIIQDSDKLFMLLHVMGKKGDVSFLSFAFFLFTYLYTILIVLVFVCIIFNKNYYKANCARSETNSIIIYIVSIDYLQHPGTPSSMCYGGPKW